MSTDRNLQEYWVLCLLDIWLLCGYRPVW